MERVVVGKYLLARRVHNAPVVVYLNELIQTLLLDFLQDEKFRHFVVDKVYALRGLHKVDQQKMNTINIARPENILKFL